MVTIEEIKREFNNMPNNNRLITLNFICGAGWELNPDKLYGLDVWMWKFTYCSNV